MKMAQLVKLNDYVSRYETDIYRYPSRFVRLKKERWERLLSDWTNRYEYGEPSTSNMNDWSNLETVGVKDKKGFRGKLKEWLPKRKNDALSIDEDYTTIINRLNGNDNELTKLKSKEQLKNAFKEEIFNFQINWASSTISEISDVRRKYYYDPVLSFLLKDLPDSYFIFYEPVVYLKKAPVDFDTIILTPSEIWLIVTLLGTEETIYQGLSDKYWIRSHKSTEEKILHPSIALKRMRSVTEHILLNNEISFP